MHAHESPMVMTLPLAILAAFSVCVGWGSPIWDAEAGFMVKLLKSSQPKPSALDDAAHHAHTMAGLVALGLASFGMVVAIVCHSRGVFQRESNSTGLRRFLDARWYFDAIYDAVLVKPTVWLSKMFAVTDKSQDDVGTPGVRYDLHSLDGVLAAPATWVRSVGGGLSEANKGLPRSYVLAMALTVVAALAILSRYVR